MEYPSVAGETPGASNVNRRRKLNWNDDRSTDKVYKSGDISALGDQSAADTPRRSGELPVAVPTPRLKADDKSADKYYANGGSDRVRGVQAARAQQKLGPAPKLGPTPKALPRADVLTSKDQIPTALDAVVDRLKGGDRPVVVYIQRGNNQVLKRTRAALDMLVTRERITEDEYRDVQLSYEPDAREQAGIAEKLGVPQAATTVKTEDNESVTVDPLDFLNSAAGDDPVVDVEAAPTVAVDTTGDVKSFPNDDDEADNDFLAPKPEPAEEPRVEIPADVITRLPGNTSAEGTGDQAAETQVVGDVDRAVPTDTPVRVNDTEPDVLAEKAGEPEAPEPTAPRRGKRSGRGAN